MDFISSDLLLAGYLDEGCLRQGFGITWTNKFPIENKDWIKIHTFDGC